jgi:hypothetical protein
VRKSCGEALTVPTITLLPSTKLWLILSELISAFRSPPVIEASTSTPFLPSTSAASQTIGLKPVASRIRSNGPRSALASASVMSCEDT